LLRVALSNLVMAYTEVLRDKTQKNKLEHFVSIIMQFTTNKRRNIYNGKCLGENAKNRRTRTKHDYLTKPQKKYE